jgi:hypothetical protein
MFNSGDTVEEVATNRRGSVEVGGILGPPVNKWTVKFHDGNRPMIKDFTIANELRLIKRSGEGGAPGLVPRDPVI